MFLALSEAFSEFHWLCLIFRFTSVVSSYNAGCGKSSFGLFDMGSSGIVRVFFSCALGPSIKNDFDFMALKMFVRQGMKQFVLLLRLVNHLQIKNLGGILPQTSLVEQNDLILAYCTLYTTKALEI